MKTTKFYKATIDYGFCDPIERDIRLQLEEYFDGNLAAVAFERNGEEWCVMTVNLPGYCPADGCAYIDTNNSPWAEEFLQEYGIAKPTKNYGHSGFCTYPLYKFDMRKFEEQSNP